jgi:amino acid adenylation domain-containing protein
MNITEFLHNLSSQNVELWVDGDKLRYRAPEEILTPAILNEIKQHKLEIINFLKSRAAIPNTFPLSYGQQALYFLYKLEPLNAAYNVAVTLRIRSHLDVSALRLAVESLIARHPMLRATFREQDGELFQEIDSDYEACFEEVDASSLTFDELKQKVVQTYQRPFNLETGPIVQATLFYVKDQDYVLLLNIHHIACDGWSIWILVDELLLLYAAQKKGVAASLPPINFTYKDFVNWQAQLLSSSQKESMQAYWQQQLAGELPVLNLATDKPRPPVQNYHGASHSFQLSPELVQKLKELAKLEGVTLYTVILAAFQVLLHRYTGQEDILLGSPTAGRSKAEFAQIVGYFVNPVVLRANFSSNPTFQTFLAQVSSTVLGAIAHQDYPFPLLVEQLQPKRDQSRSPVFQVFFVLQKTHLASMRDLLTQNETQIRTGDLLLEPFEILQQEGQEQFDLFLDMIEANKLLLGGFKYNTDLFDSSTIERMAAHFQNLLLAIVENPSHKVGELPLLSEAERHQLLVEWNDTESVYPKNKCIHQLFEEQVERTPDAVALVFEEQQLTYRQLNIRANQLAHYLQTLGVKPEVLVGICVERSFEMLVGLLGILKAGGAYVPLDPTYPQQRLSYMLDDSQVSVLLTQQKLVAGLPNHEAVVVCLDTDWDNITQQSPQNLVNNLTSENLAYTIYTSGSTGKPKAVQILHRAVVNFLCTMQQQPGITAEDVLVGVTTFTFDIASLEIFLPIIVGARLVMAKREVASDGKQLLNLLVANGATIMQATPATWQLMLEAGWQTGNQLKILCGGETLSPKLASQLQTRSTSLWNVYGPTETTIWSLISQVESQKDIKDIIPIGHPIANTKAYILDKFLQPVPIGVPGELYIGGDGLARGYLNRPELTQEKFIPNPFSTSKSQRLYKTGDLARYRRDGNIEFLGRIDDQVKLRGFRIELAEIEVKLLENPDVREAVVLAREVQPGNKQLVAYIVLNQKYLECSQEQSQLQKNIIQNIKSYLREFLPEYMIPNTIMVLESLPLSPNGKVNKRALPTPQILQPQTLANNEVPQTEAEAMLAAIWREVLQLEKVGIYDNFFDLGGHSLLIAKVTAKIQEVFGQEISPIEIFKYPTIHSFANYLNKNINKKSSATQSQERADLRTLRIASKQTQSQLRQKTRSKHNK